MKAQRCDSTTPDPTTEMQADFDDSAIGVDPTGRYSNELSAFLHEMVPRTSVVTTEAPGCSEFAAGPRVSRAGG